MLEKIDHIGIAVRSIDGARDYYEKVLDLTCEGIETIESQKVRTAFYSIGQTHIDRKNHYFLLVFLFEIVKACCRGIALGPTFFAEEVEYGADIPVALFFVLIHKEPVSDVRK